MAPTNGPTEGGAPPPDHRPPPPPSAPPGTRFPPPSGTTAVGWAPPPPQPPGSTTAPLRSGPAAPREADPAPLRLIVLAVAAGVALEIGLRGGLTNLAVAIGLAAVVAGLVTDRRLRQRSARLLALAALVPIGFLAVRASAWLAVTNLAAVALLAATAIAFSRSGRPSDTTVGRWLLRLVGAIPAACTAPAVLAPLVPRVGAQRTARLGRVVLALAVCVPVLVVVSALLAAADPVFGELLTPDVDLGPTLGHVLFGLGLALVAVCVIGAAASDTEDRVPAGRFGAIEVVTMLGLTAAVLGLFVVSQLVAATSAGQRLVERSGLTPAEYARSGFFQLCWATGLILTLLAAVRALAAPEVLRTSAVRVLGSLAPVLALGLVAVSIRRMALYDDAFGLTMLRLWVLGTAVWMGAVLLMVAARNAGVGARREWVLGASAGVALALVLVADVANPEAMVAQHNLRRADRGAELDVAYLAQLSDDATPVVAEAWDDADEQRRAQLAPALGCDDAERGVARLNVAVQRAETWRASRCETVVDP